MLASESLGGAISALASWNNPPTSTVVTMGEAGAANGLREEIVRHLPALRRFASSLCGSRADAEDLVQASIERALRAQEQWREGTRLDSWLFRIAQNLWRDQRRAARDRTVELDEAVGLEGEDGRKTVAQRSELRAFQGAFAQLPPDHQSVLALVVLHGASYEETAQALGVPKGTVMSRLARARAALATKMADRQP
jgi:RNA polymerase sigma-70 factor (ECF subfamily)